MKLSDYMPQLPQLTERMTTVNRQISMLDMFKAAGDVGAPPQIGIDTVVNSMVRNSIQHRMQLIRDVQTIVMSVEEIRGPLNHITSEVFRRGLHFASTVENPDPMQKEKLEDIRDSCNIFGQSLEEVLRQFHHDLISLDDAFLHFSKEYKDLGNGKLTSRLLEIRRLNPAMVEFDIDAEGLPKNANFLCPIHRETAHTKRGKCENDDCDIELQPVMYKLKYRNKETFLLENEVVHLSKFSPSETYGWSPVLTIFEKALTLIGMDKNLFNYFFQRKMPASMLLITTDDPESLRREREHIAAQTRADPNYIPMVAVSSRNQRGRVDMVRMFHTLQEMDYLPVRQEIRERVAAIWGVTASWQGAPEAFGGLSSQTQQLTVMSRVVEADQRLFTEKVFPQLIKCLAITDFEIELPQPEEKAENTKLSFAMQKINIASQFSKLGFEVSLKEQNADVIDAEFVVSGKATETANLAEEKTKLDIENQRKQMEQQEAQQQQQEAQQLFGMEDDTPDMDELVPDRSADRKFKGRTGGLTPNSADKAPNEERDLDSYAEARSMELSKNWIDTLVEKGFTSPLIKEVSPDLKQMWFSQDNIDYVAQLSSDGVGFIEKATFSNPEAFKQTKEQPKSPNPIKVDLDEI